MVSFDGGSASKVDDVKALPSRHKMADMCYYGNVMTTTRWWLCVITSITSSVYDCTVEDVEYIYNKLSIHIQQQKYSHRLNLL